MNPFLNWKMLTRELDSSLEAQYVTVLAFLQKVLKFYFFLLVDAHGIRCWPPRGSDQQGQAEPRREEGSQNYVQAGSQTGKYTFAYNFYWLQI